jgi:CTP:molybdopterin cytidylyltransferase MocA
LTPPRLAGLVLAAGASRRFGSPKQLALIDGVPMLQRVIETAQAVLPPDEHGSRITVVIGAHAEAVRAGVIERLAPPHPEVVVCPDWDSGMAHSLRCGLTELTRRGEGTFANETQSATSAAFVMLGDTPFLTASDLQRLIDAWRISPEGPAAAAYDGTIGAPCILPRALWPEIETLEGDRGAGAWLKARRIANGILNLVAMPKAAHDIDHP